MTGPDFDPEPLLAKAHEVRKRAHCIYSNYQVGAAILMDDETVVTGCNVENVSYGLTMCAERNAIAIALSRGYKKEQFLGMAVTIGEDKQAICCGACRQLMAEMSNDNFWVVFIGDPSIKNSKPVCMQMPELLPETKSLHCIEITNKPCWDVTALLDAAKTVRDNSYVPYSKTAHKVGAAIRLSNGQIFTGCAVENSSLGLSMRAERVVIGNVISSGFDIYKNPELFVGIAVYSEEDDYNICGGCLQIISEFCTEDLWIVLPNLEDETTPKLFRVGDLLPNSVAPAEVLRKNSSNMGVMNTASKKFGCSMLGC